MSKLLACAPTAHMQKMGMTFTDVIGYAKKSIDLVNATGTQFVGLLNDGFKAYQGITEHDYGAVFSALNAANADGKAIVAAITTTFGL